MARLASEAKSFFGEEVVVERRSANPVSTIVAVIVVEDSYLSHGTNTS